MTEDQKLAVRTLARITSLELLVTDILAMIFQSAPDPARNLAEKREQFRVGLGLLTLPGMSDAAMSDLMAGEIADAVERVFEQATDLTAVYESKSVDMNRGDESMVTQHR